MAKTVSTEPVLSRGSTQDRLIGATLVCVSRHGLAKTTVDDVAREAGVGRATLYRYFPNKQALLEATLNAEVLRISQEIHSAGEEQTDLDGALVAMMSVAANEVAHHEALQYAFANEPEQVLPHLAFEGGDRFILLAANAFAPTLARFLPIERCPQFRVVRANYPRISRPECSTCYRRCSSCARCSADFYSARNSFRVSFNGK